ncbi:hypothetical protein PCANC_06192 [Puccinia coronata f. sp. avenae]|uniref:Uncharacterized protein n=1 Tax=Puccinia coronata f. sp. avenae TaxID=200324 RepID=A0A2N5VTK2_9BASI|nr:hypothetical protein PCANC_06192 [Puccinia coronata f. sp. avenae]
MNTQEYSPTLPWIEHPSPAQEANEAHCLDVRSNPTPVDVVPCSLFLDHALSCINQLDETSTFCTCLKVLQLPHFPAGFCLFGNRTTISFIFLHSEIPTPL